MNNNAAFGRGPATGSGRAGTASVRENEPTLPKRDNARGARGIADLSLQTDAFPPRRGGDIIRFLSLAGSSQPASPAAGGGA